MLHARLQLALAVAIAGGLLASLGAVVDIFRLNAPVEQTSAIITQLDANATRRRASFTFVLANGDILRWSCRRTSCRPSTRALKALAWETPMPADMEFVGGRLVGLTVREAEVIVAEEEIGRQTGAAVLIAATGAGVALAAGGALYSGRRDTLQLPWRRRARRRALR